MLEASPDALVVADADGVIERVNVQTERLFGFSRSELIGQPVEMLLPERLAHAHQEHRTRFRASPEVRGMGSGLLLFARLADGSEIPVEVSLSPLEIEGALRVMAAVRDVSDRVEAERLRRAADARFRSAFDDGPVPMMITEISPSADRIILDANEAMSQLLGVPKKELIGRAITEFIHPDDLLQDAQLAAAQKRGDATSFQHRVRYLRADGSTVWAHLTVSLLSREGERITTIGHSVDITGSVEAERQKSLRQAVQGAVSVVRSAVLSETALPRLLEIVCQQAKTLAKADLAWLARPDAAGAQLRHTAFDSQATKAQLPNRINIDQPLEAALAGSPWISEQLPSEPLVAPALHRALADVAHTIVAVPIEGEAGVEALLLIARSSGSSPFDNEDLEALHTYALGASTTLRLDEARRVQQRLDLLEDRERIGRDMHDMVIGRLFATGMGLQSTINRIDDPSMRDRLELAVEDIDDAIRDIRTTVYGLRSQLAWGDGVRGEILAIAADQQAALGFEPRVRFEGPIDELPSIVVEHLLASLREILSNTSKHAGASNVEIIAAATDDDVLLRVSDDGLGFDVQEVMGPDAGLSGHGLQNIRHRAHGLGGRLEITSRNDAGTTIEWTATVHGSVEGGTTDNVTSVPD